MAPVSQIAILKIKGENGLTDKIMDEFRKAKKIVSEKTDTGHTFCHFQEVEDPSRIYVIGDWSGGMEWHENFKKDQKEGMPELLKYFGQLWDHVNMVHLNILTKDIAVDAPILSVGRFLIPTEKRPAFTEVFEGQMKGIMQSYLTEGKLAYGWRQEESKDGNEEFVTLAPWKNVEQHHEVAKKEKGDLIRPFFVGVDTKHIKRIYL